MPLAPRVSVWKNETRMSQSMSRNDGDRKYDDVEISNKETPTTQRFSSNLIESEISTLYMLAACWRE